MLLFEPHDGEAALLHQGDVPESRVGLDARERHGAGEGLHGFQVDHHPPGVVGRGVLVVLPSHPRYSHDFETLVAVVEKNHVSLLHAPEVVSGLVVSHPVPVGPPVADELLPRVLERFGLDEPVIHDPAIIDGAGRDCQSRTAGKFRGIRILPGGAVRYFYTPCPPRPAGGFARGGRGKETSR